MFCVHKNRPWRDVSYAVQADGGPVYRSKQMVVAYTTLIRIYTNCQPKVLAVLPMGAKLNEMFRMRGGYSRAAITGVVDRLERRPAMAAFVKAARAHLLWIAFI